MEKMPVLFVGHGSPMNAIEDNSFTAQWESIGKQIALPKAILCVSAHWFTDGVKIMDTVAPKTVYDMYGFPKELYEIVYNAPGSPHFAHLAKSYLGSKAEIDNTWGIDHGTWSVLHKMYPEAKIPVFQVSIDRNATAEDHFETGKKLRALREQGVLIVGSGNVVHNLAAVRWDMTGGYPWAEDFDGYIKRNILSHNYQDVIRFENAGASASLAFTLQDHFAPLLYILGAGDENESVYVFNDACVMGSLSMTSYVIGEML